MVLYRRTGQDIDRGLVGYWPLNDLRRVSTDGIFAHFKLDDNAADTVVIDSKFGNHATSNANTSTLTTTGLISSGSAFDMSGSTLITTATPISDLGNIFSISFWVSFDTSDLNYRTIINGNWQAPGAFTSFLYDGNLTFQVRDEDNTLINITTPVSTSTTYHVVITADGSNLRMYLDSSLVSTSSSYSGKDICYITGNMSIGGTTNDLDGQLDDVRFYDRVLSAYEVYHLYNNGNGQTATELFRPRLDGIVAHYKLNDNAANTTVIDSVYANNGTASANTSTLTTTGKINEAFTFDNSSVNVSIADNEAVHEQLNSTNEFSISAWVKLNSLDSNSTIYRQGGSGTGIGFRVLSSGTLNTILPITGDNVQLSTGTITDDGNTWVHVVTVYDGSVITHYVDNVAQSTTQAVSSALNITNTSSARIGSRSGSDEFADGVIDDVRIYNRAITAEEVSKLYNNGTGTEDTTALEVDEGTIVARDLVNFNDGTITGATNAEGINSLSPDAMSFDGVDDYVDCGDKDEFSINTTGKLTVSFWRKANSYASGYAHPIGKGLNPNYEWYIRQDNNTCYIRVNTPTATVDAGSSYALATDDDLWHHVVATYNYNGTNCVTELYIDGELKDRDTITISTYANGTATLQIGDRNHIQKFNGDIQHVRIYNRVLSDGEINKLYRLRK